MENFAEKFMLSIIFVLFGSIGSYVVVRGMEFLTRGKGFLFNKYNRPYLLLLYGFGILIMLIQIWIGDIPINK